MCMKFFKDSANDPEDPWNSYKEEYSNERNHQEKQMKENRENLSYLPPILWILLGFLFPIVGIIFAAVLTGQNKEGVKFTVIGSVVSFLFSILFFFAFLFRLLNSCCSFHF